MFVKKSRLDDALLKVEALEMRLELEQERRQYLTKEYESKVTRLEDEITYLRSRILDLERSPREGGKNREELLALLREELSDEFDVKPTALEEKANLEKFSDRINQWEREGIVDGAAIDLTFLVPGSVQQ